MAVEFGHVERKPELKRNLIAQETLEAELRALESEVGDIETLKGIATWRPGNGGEEQ